MPKKLDGWSRFEILKWTLFALHVCLVVVGFVLIGYATYLRFWVPKPFVLLSTLYYVCGVLLVITSLVGIWGILKEWRLILCCCNILLIILILYLAGFSIGIATDKTNLQNKLETELQYMTFKYEEEKDERMNTIQNFYHCCGVLNNYDFKDNEDLPRTCCADQSIRCMYNSTSLIRVGCFAAMKPTIDSAPYIGLLIIPALLALVLGFLFKTEVKAKEEAMEEEEEVEEIEERTVIEFHITDPDEDAKKGEEDDEACERETNTEKEFVRKRESLREEGEESEAE